MNNIIMEEKDLFAKIDNDEQRERLYQRLFDTSPEIQIQLENAELINVKSYRRVMNDLVIFRSLDGEPETQNVVINFILLNERYFLKSKLIQKNKNCYIALSPLLYKLQRRKNFRLQLPQTWNANYTLYLQNIDKVSKVFPLVDLSSGGFSFEYDKADFEITPAAELEGRIKVRNKLDLQVKSVVRHYKDSGTKAFPKTRVGCEFVGLSAKEEQVIIALLLEVHREVFSRLK